MNASSTLPPLALLAGGMATRLRPITETIPKSMVEVSGEPFIAHQLRLCLREGVSNIVVCGGYFCSQIEDYVGDGRNFGVTVRYSVDWPVLRGTGGAVKMALPLLGDEFFVMYGDTYLDIPFREVYSAFRGSNRSALMTVFQNQNQWDASNVEYRDDEIVSYDKVRRTPQMKHIDYGLGVIKASAFDGWPSDATFDLADLYGKLVRERDLASYRATRRFYEIGTDEGLAETAAMLAKRRSLS